MYKCFVWDRDTTMLCETALCPKIPQTNHQRELGFSVLMGYLNAWTLGKIYRYGSLPPDNTDPLNLSNSRGSLEKSQAPALTSPKQA